MESLAQFLSMGGYGAYVWPSFLLAGAVLAALLAASLRTLKRRERALATLESEGGGASGEAQA